jgi:hypothetical protein
MNAVVIVETSIFSRQVQELLSDDEYRQLQLALVLHPDLGAVIHLPAGVRGQVRSIKGGKFRKRGSLRGQNPLVGRSKVLIQSC